MSNRVSLLALCFVAAIAVAASAQDDRTEASLLAQGWALLAKGDAAGAALVAAQQLAGHPNNAAALALAVDADLASRGASAALGTYEKWLGNRKLDDGYVLRRVARGLLVESIRKPSNTSARLEALKQLAADGDAGAAAALQQASSSKSFGETRVLASLGNDRAVDQLVAQLAATPGSKAPIIDALGNSGSKRAIPPLKALLSDPNDLNRATAADALGRLGAADAIPQLRALLNDQFFTVKFKAAGALFRLNDSSGLSFLTELTNSEHASVRVAALKELAPQPSASWQNQVRSLLNDPDPTVRLEAARLIAPYDQPLASSVLDALMRDNNIAIREAASGVLVERVAADLATIRALLHSGDESVRVKAAGRVLELTR